MEFRRGALEVVVGLRSSPHFDEGRFAGTSNTRSAFLDDGKLHPNARSYRISSLDRGRVVVELTYGDGLTASGSSQEGE